MPKMQRHPDAHMRDKLPAVIHRAHHAIYLFFNEAMAAAGLTFQQAVVITFIHFNKGCNQKAIEDHMQTRSASVTVLLNTMAAKGLIVKSRNPVDARGIVLSLTAKGQRAFAKVEATFDKSCAEVVRGISEDEIEEVKRLLRIMENNCRAIVDHVAVGATDIHQR